MRKNKGRKLYSDNIENLKTLKDAVHEVTLELLRGQGLSHSQNATVLDYSNPDSIAKLWVKFGLGRGFFKEDRVENGLNGNKMTLELVKRQGLSWIETVTALGYSNPNSVGDLCVKFELGRGFF